MKRVNHWFFSALLLGIVALFPFGVKALELPQDVKVEKTTDYVRKRAFNRYYPYNFNYYYQRPGYYMCSWRLINGTYVYTCS